MFTFIVWVTNWVGIQRVNLEEWKVVERVNENSLATFDHEGRSFYSEEYARRYIETLEDKNVPDEWSLCCL